MPDSKQRKVDLAKAREAINITHINCERCKARVARVADALQRERDKAERNAVRWLLAENNAYYGCLTGDCPHTDQALCLEATLKEIHDYYELRRRRGEGG